MTTINFVSDFGSGETYVACADNLALSDPGKVCKRQSLGADADDGAGWLTLSSWVRYRDGRIHADKCECVSRGAESDTLDPASGLIEVFAADGVERQTLAPNTRLRPLVNALDKCTKDPCMSVCTSDTKQYRVGMPCDTGDCAAQWLFQVLRHPPIVLFLEIAYGCDSCSTSYSKLGLARAPAYTSRGSVDAQQDQSWPPRTIRSRFPDVGVAVLRAGHNLARVWCNVDASDELVVASQLVPELELGARGRVELDIIVAGDGKGRVVGAETVVRNWVVKEMVHLRRGHVGRRLSTAGEGVSRCGCVCRRT